MPEAQPSTPAWIKSTLDRVLEQESSRQPQTCEEKVSRHLGQEHLRTAGISLRHRKILLAPGVMMETTALKAVRAFHVDPSQWCLTLLGLHGTGKTLAAEWFILESLRGPLGTQDRSKRLINPYELRDAAYESNLRVSLQKRYALVMDDLGCEGQDRWGIFNSILFEILDYRWRNEKKTVITSNLTGPQFQLRYGRRVTDRIAHGGRCIAIRGANMRTESD